MNPLWSDMAQARAAWAAVEGGTSTEEGKTNSQEAERPAARRPVRRVLHPRLGSCAL